MDNTKDRIPKAVIIEGIVEQQLKNFPFIKNLIYTFTKNLFIRYKNYTIICIPGMAKLSDSRGSLAISK